MNSRRNDGKDVLSQDALLRTSAHVEVVDSPALPPRSVPDWQRKTLKAVSFLGTGRTRRE